MMAMTNWLAAAAALAASAALTACAASGPGASPDAAEAEPSALEAPGTRYTISYEGDIDTTRRQVEQGLLYRAALAAEEAGSPYFAVVEADARPLDQDPVYPVRSDRRFFAGLAGETADFSYPYQTGWDYGGMVDMTPVAPVGPIGPLSALDEGEPIARQDTYRAYATVELLDAPTPDRDDVLETRRVLDRLEPRVDAPEA